MQYIDGFVAAVPTAKKADYLRHAKDAVAVFKDHGATRVVECWGEDVPDGEITSGTSSPQHSTTRVAP